MATTNRGTLATETFGTTSPVSGAAPTAVDGTDGQPARDLDSVQLVVRAPSGQTLSGAGTMDCYVLDVEVGTWARYPTGDFSVSTSGVRTLAFEPSEVLVPRGGFFKWIPTGVTFSGGSSGLEVFQLGYAKALKGTYRAP